MRDETDKQWSAPSSWGTKRIVGVLCAATAAAIAISLAVVGSSTKPPAAATQGLLAFVAVAAQVGAGWAFSRLGVVDEAHPRAAIRRLERLRIRSSEAKRIAESMVDLPDMEPTDRGEALGSLSVWMSVIQEEVVEAMEDWYAAVPHAVTAAAKNAEEQVERYDH